MTIAYPKTFRLVARHQMKRLILGDRIARVQQPPPPTPISYVHRVFLVNKGHEITELFQDHRFHALTRSLILVPHESLLYPRRSRTTDLCIPLL